MIVVTVITMLDPARVQQMATHLQAETGQRVVMLSGATSVAYVPDPAESGGGGVLPEKRGRGVLLPRKMGAGGCLPQQESHGPQSPRRRRPPHEVPVGQGMP